MLHATALFSAPLQWDFEDGLKGWGPWGLTARSLPLMESVVSIVPVLPHSGQSCLQIFDDKSDCNPYAVVFQDVAAGNSYLFKGWLRASESRPMGPYVSVSAMGEKGKFIQWLPVPQRKAGLEWTEFRIEIKDIPAETVKLCLAINPTRGLTNEATAAIWADDIEFGQIPKTGE